MKRERARQSCLQAAKEDQFQAMLRQTHIAESLIAPTNYSIQLDTIKVDQSVAESFRFYDPSQCGSAYKQSDLATPQLPGATEKQSPTG